MRKIQLSLSTKKRLLMVLDGIVVIGVVVLVIMAAIIIKNNADAQQQGRQNQKNADARKEQIIAGIQSGTDRLERDMACLGAFFSQPDRASLRITDLQGCHIINDSTGQERTLDYSQFLGSTKPESSNPIPATPSATAQPSTSNNQSQQPNNPPASQEQPGLVRGTVEAAGRTINSVLDLFSPSN